MAAVRRMQRGAAACYRRTLRLRVKSSTCARHPRRSAFSHRQKGSLLTHSLTSALTYTHGTHAHTPAHTHRYLSSVVGLPHRTGAARAYSKRSTRLSHTACSASRCAQAGANLDYDRCRRRRRRLPLPFPLPLLHFRCRARQPPTIELMQRRRRPLRRDRGACLGRNEEGSEGLRRLRAGSARPEEDRSTGGLLPNGFR
jgi:hypothetical protein